LGRVSKNQRLWGKRETGGAKGGRPTRDDIQKRGAKKGGGTRGGPHIRRRQGRGGE